MKRPITLVCIWIFPKHSRYCGNYVVVGKEEEASVPVWEGKEREGNGREWKGREWKGREGNGREWKVLYSEYLNFVHKFSFLSFIAKLRDYIAL